MTDAEAWESAPAGCRWMYDKLLLAKALGHVCGPAQAPVPNPGLYCVRPITNLAGMGEGSRRLWIKHGTEHLPAGHFWCEWFEGEHLSADYEDGRQVLSVLGDPMGDLQRWYRWSQIERSPVIPDLLANIPGPMNVEYIGGRVIEVHFRRNPDFRWGNTIAIPVYDEGEAPQGMRYVHDPDGPRIGFWID